MLDLESIKRRSEEASKNRRLTQLRDGLAILDDNDALIAEVERLQGIINTALSLSKPNG